MYSTGIIVESEVLSSRTRQWMRQKSSSKMPFSMGEVGVGYEIDSVQSLHVSMSTTWFATKKRAVPPIFTQAVCGDRRWLSVVVRR